MTGQGRRAETMRHQALKRAILDLPPDLRDALLLHRFARLSFDEIGQTMDLEREEVEAYLAEAMYRIVDAAWAPEV